MRLRAVIAAFFLSMLLLPVAGTRAQTAQPDIVEISHLDQQSCCLEVSLLNAHVPESDLDRFVLQVFTKDVQFAPNVGGPWPATIREPNKISFGTPGSILPPRQLLEGFHFCMMFRDPQNKRFMLSWQTWLGQKLISADSIDVECKVNYSVCDTVLIKPGTLQGQPDETQMLDITIRNTHTPISALDDFHLTLVTPDASFVGPALGPWSTTSNTSSAISWATTNRAIAPGDALGGFKVFVRPPTGIDGDVTVRWRTTTRGETVCEGEQSIAMKPVQYPRGDSLLIYRTADCSYRIGFINLHKPRSPIDGMKMSVLTPGASFGTVTPAAGWTTASLTGLNARFTQNIGQTVYGDSVSGFMVAFKPSVTGEVRFTIGTMLGVNVVSSDTLVIFCTPAPPTVCDTIGIVESGDCEYQLELHNLHRPPSGLDQFQLTLESADAAISAVTPPAGWTLISQSPSSFQIKNLTGSLPSGSSLPGLQVQFTPGPSGAVVFEWCSGFQNILVCCARDRVQCAPILPRCDSLAVKSLGSCRYDLSLTNKRFPQTGLTRLDIDLTTTGAVIDRAVAATGWVLDSSSSRTAHFSSAGDTLRTGATATGFLLDLLPQAPNTRIHWNWCTSLDGTEMCCDTASAICDTPPERSDSLDVITSPTQPCCFEFRIRNLHYPPGALNGLRVQTLTPDVIIWTSTVGDPNGWTHIANSSMVSWTSTAGAAPGDEVVGFTVCYDNDATGNRDFRVAWNTLLNGGPVSMDTLTVKCDRTLAIDVIDGDLPQLTALRGNFPNPFNPSTSILFDVATASDLELQLLDANGRLITVLASGRFPAGRYQIAANLSGLPSGLYLCRLRAGGVDQTRSMILLK